jgi:Family of unknown function (DUF6134)
MKTMTSRKVARIMKKLILLAYLLLAAPMLQAKEWAFDVYLDKSKIGKHTFTFNDNTLISKAKFNVKVLFINAYQYDHTAKEQWQNDCLSNIDVNTTEDKVNTIVKGKKTATGFEVSDAKTSQTLPECVMTFAYWNPKILTQSKLLNPQNAEYLDTTITKLGAASIEAKGKPTETTHYKLTGALKGVKKLNIELWYNLNNEWVALKSVTPEGYNIIYKLK